MKVIDDDDDDDDGVWGRIVTVSRAGTTTSEEIKSTSGEIKNTP